MNFGLLFLLSCVVVFAVTYWSYCRKVEVGDVFAFNDNDNSFVRVTSVSKKYVYYEHKKEILCMEKKQFIKNFHKIHFYV